MKWAVLGIVLVLSMLVGCGTPAPTTAKVSGKVSLPDGSPLTGGRIDFKSAASGQVSGVIKADGTYEAVGVPLGPQEVSITNKHLEGVQSTPGMPGSDQKYVAIDPKFLDPKTSGLSTNVNAPTVAYDVKLQ